MKKIFILSTVIIIALILSSCEKEEKEVYTASMFYGVWQDENSTNYHCSDMNGVAISFSGETIQFTWSVSDNKLYKYYENGYTDVGTIIEVNSTSYTKQDVDDGDLWNAVKKSGSGCNYPETDGQGTFWTSEDLSCGNISVFIEGTYAGKISGYYSSITPSCGADDCVTITQAPGTYNWNAECTSYTWNGTITIYDNNCSTMQLTLKKAKLK